MRILVVGGVLACIYRSIKMYGNDSTPCWIYFLFSLSLEQTVKLVTCVAVLCDLKSITICSHSCWALNMIDTESVGRNWLDEKVGHFKFFTIYHNVDVGVLFNHFNVDTNPSWVMNIYWKYQTTFLQLFPFVIWQRKTTRHSRTWQEESFSCAIPFQLLLLLCCSAWLGILFRPSISKEEWTE